VKLILAMLKEIQGELRRRVEVGRMTLPRRGWAQQEITASY
jgi:hypothetical protein